MRQEKGKALSMITLQETANRTVRDEMRRARVSVADAARHASMSANSWRLWEANPFAVSEPLQERANATLEWIRSIAKAREAA